MTNDKDIVTRLRNCVAQFEFVDRHNGNVLTLAADEIERLRRLLLAEENATDIFRNENEQLQKDRNNCLLRAEEAERTLGLYREWIGDEMLAAARRKQDADGRKGD